MLDRDLSKHAAEFHKYLSAGNFVETDEGILFPTAGALASGEYFYDSFDGTERTAKNKVPTAALNYFLETGLRGGSAHSVWYLALFSGAYTPTDTLTAATFPAAATEIVSGAEGYSETLRQTWASAAATSGQSDNVASKATFTIVTASSLTIRGAALVSEAIKGSTSGLLVSCARFGVDEVKNNGSTFQLGYRVKLRDV